MNPRVCENTIIILSRLELQPKGDDFSLRAMASNPNRLELQGESGIKTTHLMSVGNWQDIHMQKGLGRELRAHTPQAVFDHPK